jgi:hypothetical protein
MYEKFMIICCVFGFFLVFIKAYQDDSFEVDDHSGRYRRIIQEIVANSAIGRTLLVIIHVYI